MYDGYLINFNLTNILLPSLHQDTTFLNKKEVLRVLDRFLELDKDLRRGGLVPWWWWLMLMADGGG